MAYQEALQLVQGLESDLAVSNLHFADLTVHLGSFKRASASWTSSERSLRTAINSNLKHFDLARSLNFVKRCLHYDRINHYIDPAGLV